MKEILAKYQGQQIGMNLRSDRKEQAVTLQSVDNEFFTVTTLDGEIHHYPYSVVCEVVEAAPEKHFTIGSLVKRQSVRALVSVNHPAERRLLPDIGIDLSILSER